MMRFTVVDESGTVSFVAPPHALKALAAACSRGASDHVGLLALMGEYDATLAEAVMNGLHVFDEHNTTVDARAVHGWLEGAEPARVPPFRVVDDVTRRASLEPVKQGLIVFNLLARRIVQVQNSYANLERADRGRIRRNGRPTSTLYHYRLAEDWQIVP